MRISRKRLNEIVDKTVRRILKEYGEPGNYHVIWDFLERHTYKTVTKGAKRFSDLDDAYEYLTALMTDMRGKFARTLAITQDGKIIYDASGGKMYKHSPTSQAEIERELRPKQEEDPTPYGSYRTLDGFLKTPRQEPIWDQDELYRQEPKERTVKDITWDLEKAREKADYEKKFIDIGEKAPKYLYDALKKAVNKAMSKPKLKNKPINGETMRMLAHIGEDVANDVSETLCKDRDFSKLRQYIIVYTTDFLLHIVRQKYQDMGYPITRDQVRDFETSMFFIILKRKTPLLLLFNSEYEPYFEEFKRKMGI